MIMENIAFVLWVIAWPVASSLSSLYEAKRKKIANEEEYSSGVRFVATLFDLGTWVGVGWLLYC